MAPFAITRVHRHPYASFSKQHAHFMPTEVTYAPYTAACVPFRWMSKKSLEQLRTEYSLELSEAYEPDLGFKSNWVQDARNHRELLDCFFGHVRPETSLCFFYAKQVPFLDDSVRALVGVGRVSKLGSAVEYAYRSQGDLRSLIWERAVKHSIRPDSQDGFLLPYHAAVKNDIDPSEFAATVPEDRGGEFMYASELMTHDGAISSLLAIADALQKAESRVDGPWRACSQWVSDRLAEVWRMRGPFPGLASALAAFQIPMATFIAREIEKIAGEGGDVWELVDRVIADPQAHLPNALATNISGTLQKAYLKLPSERRALLKLLSRFELNAAQSTLLFAPELRREAGVSLSDKQILGDPYLLPEATRATKQQVDVLTIDRGAYPSRLVAQRDPISEPTRMDGDTDPRRVRAMIVESLEQAATQGHTLLPRDAVVRRVKEMRLDPPCPLTGDMAAVAEDHFASSIALSSMSDGAVAYQLARLSAVGSLIRDKVNKRQSSPRLNLECDWTTVLRSLLGESGLSDLEVLAREEKVAALAELANSRLSVLVGPAGTGKTTLLTALCSNAQVAAGGVLLLAPTGKARIRMSQAAKGTSLEAYTIAQFLSGRDRFDGGTQLYMLSAEPPYRGAKTVIVDEASMLTEEMLGALLDALSGVERLILVGDPQQLPPIGAGRPFADIVAKLKPSNSESRFPRVDSCYAELTIRRRQTGHERLDLEIAEWFSGRPLGPGDDDVFDRVVRGEASDHIQFVRWDTPTDLEAALDSLLHAEFQLSSDDPGGFDLRLGAKKLDYGSFFGLGSAATAEDWQILTPVRQMGHGVESLNRAIHRSFRTHWVRKAQKGFDRKIPKPCGPQEIVYGDKVICTVNHSRGNEPKYPKVYPVAGSSCYLANGEIGIVIGEYKKAKMTWEPRQLEVEFATQPGFMYKFWPTEFEGDEGAPPLELAYALTIHKAQGSEFGVVFLILPNPCRLLSRELIYTAVTRQRDKIVVLHQGAFAELKKFGSAAYSETARRLTNLFVAPTMVEIDGKFLEDGLIHRTCDGIPVRSKSEVIVYDQLHLRGLRPLYEQPLSLGGDVRYPDFTIEDDDSGATYFWEHCGMLGDPTYRDRWEKKRRWYIDNGVLPLEQGGGPLGTLIVTEDSDRGGISSQAIADLISRTFFR